LELLLLLQYLLEFQPFCTNNDDAKINDIESPDSYSEKIAITTTTNVITDLVENIGR